MRRTHRNLGVVGLTLAVVHSAGCSGATAPTEPADPVASLVAAVNRHRSSIGCSSLQWHGRLAEVAQSHSEDMAHRSFFGHVNPDGESPFDRMRRAGIRWVGPAGENLARADGSPGDVLRMWLESEGHRANVEDCRYGFHAVGLSDGYWTHLFLSEPRD